MLRFWIPSLLVLASLVPIAAAHHTPDCGAPLVGSEPGVSLHADGCVGARVVLPGTCMEYIHPLGHNSCEYVIAAPLPEANDGATTCDMIPIVREEVPPVRVVVAAGPGCYYADAWAPLVVCLATPRLTVPYPGGEAWVDTPCGVHAQGGLPSAPRMTCAKVVHADLATPATVGAAEAGSVCAHAWAGQTVLPCPLVPTLTVPIPGGHVWIWPMCAAGVQWTAPLPLA